MKARLTALFTGLLAGALLAAPMLLLQHRRLAGARPSSPVQQAKPAGPSVVTPDTFSEAWQRLMDDGGEDAELRAAKTADSLDAAACAASADRAVKNKAPVAMLRAVIGRWAALEPRKAMLWVRKHSEIKEAATLFADAAAGWAALDPAGLAAWWSEQTSDPAGEKAILEALLPADITVAMELALKGGNKVDIKVLARGVKDSPSAEKAMMLASGDLYVSCRRLWLRYDPLACLAWEEAHSGVMETKNGIPGARAAAVLGASDTVAAATAVLSGTRTDQRSETMSLLISQWAPVDPETAGTWLTSQPATPDRWAAAAEYAVACVSADIRTALKWVETIGDETIRAGAERRIFLKWYETDPGAAESWLAAGNWPPEVKLEMRERAAVIPGRIAKPARE